MKRSSSKLAAALDAAPEARGAPALQTDPQLIGGAVLRSGDLVIDGSVRARLERIAYELVA